METRTRVLITSKDEGYQLTGPVIGTLLRGQKVTMHCQVPPSYIPLNLPASSVITVTKTADQIREKGGNIFFRFAEKLGKGKVAVHTTGLIMVQYNVWWFWQAQIQVQYYRLGSKLFTTSLLHQKEIEAELKKLVQADKDVPPYSDYKEFLPKPETIKWFDPFRMIGALVDEKGQDVFFHWKNFDKVKPYVGDVKHGAKVEFYPVEEKGSFSQKACFVKLI